MPHQVGSAFSQGLQRVIGRLDLPWSIHRLSAHLFESQDQERFGDAIIGFIRRKRERDASSRYPSPIINLSGNRWQPTGGAVVCMDDEAIGMCAARYYLDQGYRHFLAYDLADKAGAPLHPRTRGFVETVTRLGHDCRIVIRSGESGMPHARDSYAVRMKKFTALLSECPKPVACFFHTDRLSENWYEAAISSGLTIPGEVAFLGADNNIEYCTSQEPYLSSVDIPWIDWSNQVVHTLLRLFSGTVESAPILCKPRRVVERGSSRPKPRSALTRSAVRYMDRHLIHLTVDELALHCGVSTATLNRAFREEYNTSAYRYFLRRRIRKAEDLLRRTRKTVAEVATGCGFTTTRQFYNAFKQVHGVSPGAWREQELSTGYEAAEK